MRQDRYGLPLTTTSDRAADAYREGADLLLAAWPGATEKFDAAIAADPGFALAQLARARMHQMYGEVPAARELAAIARRLAPSTSQREQSHIEAIASAVESQPARSIAAAEAHLETWPRDAMVMSLLLGAFGLYAFSGRADHDAARVAICERHARHYGADWWFLTYLGWSHTEAGNAGAGRLLTEQALALRADNANAAHSLAHAMLEQGELDACARFMDGWLPRYDHSGILNGHLCWHQALGALDAGDTATALRIYDERIRPGVTEATPLNALTDAASLLWRAELAGAPRSAAAWAEVIDYGTPRFPKPGLAFADVHMALMLAAGRGDDGATERLAAIEAMAEKRGAPADPVAVAVSRGLAAFAAHDYAAAARALEPVAADAVRIGGSHAQRELVEDTLIVALMRSGEPARARHLIDQRLHRRPSRRDAAWRAATTAA